MSDAYDSALCKGYFATLGCKLLDGTALETPAGAGSAAFHFIEGFLTRGITTPASIVLCP